MSHVPHELNEEFPDLAQTMSQMRQSDAHFAKLTDDYHVLNRELHRAETNVEPTSDDHLVEMRKQRLALKDAIYAIVKSKD
ncbi:YdcH family protein [Yoonia sp. 208BN28-4]|uniref:YdcH family protein n=1 Tax=Yoonia sp. 208BN28-4 TaxID=3126505 RepID=UPI0030A52970